MDEPLRVRDFVAERPLGSGGMATVYLARAGSTDQKVALKLMHPHLVQDQVFVARFLREIQATVGLAHENIVRVVDCGEDQGRYFIAAEFVDGGSLEELLRLEPKLPAAVAAEIVRQVLLGLSHAHSHNVVHRDIKPANLLLSGQGLVKIADFGIAKSRESTVLTQTGSAIGTPAYMSPEQATGTQLDHRSDLFSTGIVFYEALSGINPFLADTPAATMVKVLKADPPMLAEVAPAVPQALADVVERLMAGEPNLRYPDAAEAAAALDAWLASECVRGRQALMAFLRNPTATSKRANEHAAQHALRRAREALASGPGGVGRAAIEVHRALSCVSGFPAAVELRGELEASHHVSFAASTNPKIAELGTALAQSPGSVGVHVQLASLYRLEGNLWKAAIHLRKAVQLRPSDGYIAGQLFTLTGQKVGAPTFVVKSAGANRSAPPTPSLNAEEELHTGHTGEVRPRQPTGILPQPSQLLPAPVTPEQPIAVQYVQAFWRGGGSWLVLILAVIAVLVLTVRWAIHKIDYATEEADKATELAFKLSEARARELTAQRLKQVQDVSARRDELYDERLNAAKSLAAAGRHEEAAEAFAAIVAREGRSATGAAAQRLRAESLLAAGKSAAAAAELEDFVRNNPDHPEAPEARVLLAEANYASKSFSAAVEAATRAVAARPDGPLAVRARVVRARARLELAERNDALQDAMWVKDHAASTDPAYIAAVEVITAVTGEALPEPPTDEAVLPR